MERENVRTKRRIPLYFYIVAALTLIAGGCSVAFRYSAGFSDLFNGTVAAFLRRALAYLTNLFPFSLAETLIALSPILLTLLLWIGYRIGRRGWRETLLFVGAILSIICILFQLFTFAFAPGYHTETVDKKLGLERKDVSAQELYETAMILCRCINEENDGIFYGSDGFSVMPYTTYELNALLLDAYDTVAENYDFIGSFYSTVKPVVFSRVMSYTHITGVYTFFTGEANINVDFPDYTIPYTAAHELAHQRGIAREDEANFVAFLVCISSRDAYIRYSGLVGVFDYVMNALYRADKDLYYKVRGEMEEVRISESRAYSEFFKKYQKSTVGKVSGAINDSYLQSQGTPGTKSYGMVVDLAVAYIKGWERP